MSVGHIVDLLILLPILVGSASGENATASSLPEAVQNCMDQSYSMEHLSHKLTKLHHQADYAFYSNVNYFKCYQILISLKNTVSQGPEDQESCRLLLRIITGEDYVSADVITRHYLHVLSCVVAAHLASLSRHGRKIIHREGEDNLAKCTAIERQAANETDYIKALQLQARTMRYLVYALFFTLQTTNGRPPLRGMQALRSQLRIEGWAQRISLPMPPASPPTPPHQWGRVTFVAFKDIQCDPEWVQCNQSRVGSLPVVLMKIVAEHIGSPFCVNVEVDETLKKWNLPQLTGLTSVAYGLYDVHLHSSWMAISRHLDILYPHMQNDCCVMVKRLEHQRQSIILSFFGEMWACTTVSCLAFAGALLLAGRRSVPLEVLRTFLTGTFDDRQRPLSNFLSLLLSAFGLIVVSAFSGVFMSFLMVPGEVEQLQTLEQVDARVTGVIGSPRLDLLSWGLDKRDVVSRLIAKQDKRYGGLNESFYDLGEYAIIASRSELDIMIRSKYGVDAERRPRLHIVPQCIKSPAYMSFSVRRNFPLRENISSLLQNLVEGGVLNKLNSDYRFKTLIQKVSTLELQTDPDDSPRILDSVDSVEPLILLGIGLALALFAFVLELLSYRWQQYRRHRVVNQPLRHWTCNFRNDSMCKEVL